MIDLKNITHTNSFPFAILAECVTSTATTIDIYYHTTAIPRTGLMRIGRTGCGCNCNKNCGSTTPRCSSPLPAVATCGVMCPPSEKFNPIRLETACCGDSYCDLEWTYYGDIEILNTGCDVPTIRLKNVIRGVDPMSNMIEYNHRLVKSHEAGTATLLNPATTHWYQDWLKGRIGMNLDFTVSYPFVYENANLSLKVGQGLMIDGDETTAPHGELAARLDNLAGVIFNSGMISIDDSIIQQVSRMDITPPVATAIDPSHYLSTQATYDYVTQKIAEFSDYQGAFSYFSQQDTLSEAINTVMNVSGAVSGQTAMVWGKTEGVLQKGTYNGTIWTWETIPATQITNGNWIYVEELLDIPNPDGSFPSGKAIFKDDGTNPATFDLIVDRALRPDGTTIVYNGLSQIAIAPSILNQINSAVKSVNDVTPDGIGNVAITGDNIPTSATQVITIGQALNQAVVTGGTIKTADITPTGVTITLASTNLMNGQPASEITLTLPVASAVYNNPNYRGSHANTAAINAIPSPAFGQFADNQATNTEWTFDGFVWANSGNPIGTTPHTLGENQAGIVTSSMVSDLMNFSQVIAALNSRIDQLESLAIMTGDTLDPNI